MMDRSKLALVGSRSSGPGRPSGRVQTDRSQVATRARDGSQILVTDASVLED